MRDIQTLDCLGLDSTHGRVLTRQDSYFFHTEEQSAALHVTYASGSKAHLGQLLNKEQMLNIKDALLTMAVLALSLFSQLGAPQAMLMHRLGHFPTT